MGKKDTCTSKGYLLVKDGELYQGAETEAAYLIHTNNKLLQVDAS